MQKPLRPILTEEELELSLDDDDISDLVNDDQDIGYRIVVSGIDEKNEENGFYWRSEIFESPEEACSKANLLTPDQLSDIKKGTKELLVEVYSVYQDEEDQMIFKINLII